MAVLLVALVLLLFGRSIHFDFVGFDDQLHILENPYFNPPTLGHVLQLWKGPYEEVYMPVTYSVWGVLARIGEVATPDAQGVRFNPYLFHAANVALHAVNVLLVWRILVRLVAPGWAAVGGAALFAVHPLQVEAVGWVSSGKDLLGAAFSLAAILLYLRFTEATEKVPPRPVQARILLYTCATAAFALAYLSKATSIVTPAILLIMLRVRGPWKRPAAAWLIPWFLAALPLIWLTRLNQADARLLIWSPWWARPIEAVDAVSFYLLKLM